MSANQTQIGIIIEAQDKVTAQLKGIEKSLNSLGAKMEKTSTSTEGLGASLKKFAGIGTAIAVAWKTFDFIKDGIGEFAQDEQMLVRLAQVTRNSTGATIEQVMALRDQSEELEKIGVISSGNIVTLQGQLATYDLTTESIKTLTPALLDMAVAERGVNVTQQDMISFAEGVSKALQGNYASLQKRGFILSEDTKKIIENGTEAERVAEITAVLNSTYKDMNRVMSETASGSMAQMKNKVDALKGATGQHLMPVLGLLIDNFVDLISVGGDVNTILYTIGESMWRLTKLGETLVGGAENYGRAIIAPVATTGSFFKGFYKEAFENGLGDAFDKGVENASKTLDGFVDKYGETQQEIQKDFSEIWGKTSYDPSGFDFNKLGGDGLGNLSSDVESKSKEIEDSLMDLSKSYADFGETVDDNLYELSESHKKNLANIKESMSDVRNEMRKLEAEYESSRKKDVSSVAGQIVAEEQRIAEIQKEMQGDISQSRYDELLSELNKKQLALEENSAFIQSIEGAVTEARRVAGLTELEKAIEDFNTRREIAQQEFNSKMSDLKNELDALKKKRKEENQLYEEKRDFILELEDDMQKRYKEITASNLAITKSSIEKEIEYYKMLAEAINEARSGNASGVSRIQGKISKVNDAIISPDGDIITTHPDDYIIATKNPKSLGGGNGIVVNINGGMYLDENSARKIGDELIRVLDLQYKS